MPTSCHISTTLASQAFVTKMTAISVVFLPCTKQILFYVGQANAFQKKKVCAACSGTRRHDHAIVFAHAFKDLSKESLQNCVVTWGLE